MLSPFIYFSFISLYSILFLLYFLSIIFSEHASQYFIFIIIYYYAFMLLYFYDPMMHHAYFNKFHI